jgi:hypothetical protein
MLINCVNAEILIRITSILLWIMFKSVVNQKIEISELNHHPIELH